MKSKALLLVGGLGGLVAFMMASRKDKAADKDGDGKKDHQHGAYPHTHHEKVELVSGPGTGGPNPVPAVGLADLGPGKPSVEALDAAVLDAIDNNDYQMQWHRLAWQEEGPGGTWTVYLPVSSALKIGGSRVVGSQRLHQLLADKMNLQLPTSKIADMVHHQADIHTPVFGNTAEFASIVANADNMDMASAALHSQRIDEAVDRREGLIDNEGKWYVLTKRFWNEKKFGNSANYGWWAQAKTGKPVQGQLLSSGNYTGSLAHNLNKFWDYSQMFRFAGPKVEVIGPEGSGVHDYMPTAEVLTHPDYAFLLSYEGPLPEARHPGVPLAVA